MKITADYVFLQEGKLLSGICIDVSDNGIINEIRSVTQQETDIVKYEGILVSGLFNCHAHLELAGHHFEETQGIDDFLLQMKKAYNSDIFLKNQNEIKNQDSEFSKQGIVFVADICNTKKTIETKKTSNVTYYNFIEIFESFFENSEEKFNTSLKTEREFRKHGLQSSIVPHALYSISEKVIEFLQLYNYNNKNITSIHFKECLKENELLEMQQYIYKALNSKELVFKNKFYQKKKILEVLNTLFDIEQYVLFVHSIYMNNKECDFILKHYQNSAICICPTSNLKLEGKMAEKSIIEKFSKNVFLGTDGEVSNKKMKLIQEMFLFQNFYKKSIEEILLMVTVQPAEFFQQEKLGKIEPGKRPGLCLIKSIDKRNMRLTEKSESERII